MDTLGQNIVPAILLITGIFTGLYGAYFMIVALIGLKRPRTPEVSPPKTRFAVVVAARNEAAVIGQLVDSLAMQNYPSELYDIYVAPNNCYDDTEAVARHHGAEIFMPSGTITGKGEVLTQVVEQLSKEARYDAMCVFDADNLVHPEFLARMNDAYSAGYKVAQGFRDSKNPSDSAISSSYSVIYWFLSRFYNGGREILGLSSIVNGSGFMVSIPLLAQFGGWHTVTMTEDYEISAQCVLAGEKVHYVPEAIIYDEQPEIFTQSWKQRRRWSTGRIQAMRGYMKALFKRAAQEHDIVSLDLAITFSSPIILAISFFTFFLTAFLHVYRMFEYSITPQLAAISFKLIGMFILLSAAAFCIALLIKGELAIKMRRGVLYFAFFMVSWLPIEVISMIKQQETWDQIAHTRAITFAELNDAHNCL